MIEYNKNNQKDIKETKKMYNLNPNNEEFNSLLKESIYVDKTKMLSFLNSKIDTKSRFIAVSRPRRFGKTSIEDMMTAYYSCGANSEELFSKFEIAKDPSFKKHLNKYNVLFIDIQGMYSHNADMSFKEHLFDVLYEDFTKDYPEIQFKKNDLEYNIRKIYDATGKKFIVILDEYDSLIREPNVDKKDLDDYLDILNKIFKNGNLTGCIALGYLTGILPIVKDRAQSKLNNFKEYTILDSEDLAPYIGFTKDEVQSLCEKYNMDMDKMVEWYDGYRLNGIEIFNPRSIITAIGKKKYADYWCETGTYAVVTDYLDKNFKGVKEDFTSLLAGNEVKVDTSRYNNSVHSANSFVNKNDIYSYLMHIGYLAYNENNETCRIPNKEIMIEMQHATEASIDKEYYLNILEDSQKLLEYTLNRRTKEVSQQIEKMNEDYGAIRAFNNESEMQMMLTILYGVANPEYKVIRKYSTGRGYSDIILDPIDRDYKNKPVVIIELKKNESTQKALKQIYERDYARGFKGAKEILLVGINYDSKTKHFDCEIKEYKQYIAETVLNQTNRSKENTKEKDIEQTLDDEYEI